MLLQMVCLGLQKEEEKKNISDKLCKNCHSPYISCKTSIFYRLKSPTKCQEKSMDLKKQLWDMPEELSFMVETYLHVKMTEHMKLNAELLTY